MKFQIHHAYRQVNQHMRIWPPILLLAIALATLVSGCGGDSQSNAASIADITLVPPVTVPGNQLTAGPALHLRLPKAYIWSVNANHSGLSIHLLTPEFVAFSADKRSEWFSHNVFGATSRESDKVIWVSVDMQKSTSAAALFERVWYRLGPVGTDGSANTTIGSTIEGLRGSMHIAIHGPLNARVYEGAWRDASGRPVTAQCFESGKGPKEGMPIPSCDVRTFLSGNVAIRIICWKRSIFDLPELEARVRKLLESWVIKDQGE